MLGKKCTFISIFLLSSFISPVFSQNHSLLKNDQEENCWVKAGETYQVNPHLLYAIAQKESSLNPLAINARSETDEDVGLMQINSFWLPKLKKYGIERDDLFEPCISIHVGAWVLAHSMITFGNTWEAVGAYNVGTSKEKWAYEARKKYSDDVRRRYNNIVRGMHKYQ